MKSYISDIRSYLNENDLAELDDKTATEFSEFVSGCCELLNRIEYFADVKNRHHRLYDIDTLSDCAHAFFPHLAQQLISKTVSPAQELFATREIE